MTSPAFLLAWASLLAWQVDPSAPDTLAQTIEVVERVSLLELLVKGGGTMVPIGLLSVLTVYLFVERVLTLRRADADPDSFTQSVREYVREGDVAGARRYCREFDTPMARIIRAGLDRLGRPISEIKEAVQAAGKHETFLLERRLDLIASSAAIAPMLGFLGTVIGMIRAFQQIQNLQGSVNPSVLAEGIWEALVTTAAGLAVGVVALFAYNFLVNRISRTVNDLERASTDFIDLLQTPSTPRPPAGPPRDAPFVAPYAS
ncbi:MAG: MotA/TolQ/ExbB proton channel family protein [Bacteroidota bacterium]